MSALENALGDIGESGLRRIKGYIHNSNISIDLRNSTFWAVIDQHLGVSSEDITAVQTIQQMAPINTVLQPAEYPLMPYTTSKLPEHDQNGSPNASEEGRQRARETSSLCYWRPYKMQLQQYEKHSN